MIAFQETPLEADIKIWDVIRQGYFVSSSPCLS